MTLFDENAFGLLVSYHDIENDEYALDAGVFTARCELFRSTVVECLGGLPLAEEARAVDLGHAVYVEFADGDQTEDPIAWLRMVSARLRGRDLHAVSVLTYGSRWIDEGSDAWPETEFAGGVALVTVASSSEPMRRALAADAAARGDAESGWGAGLYLDVEAVDALGRKPKNSPTVLEAGGGEFYRAG